MKFIRIRWLTRFIFKFSKWRYCFSMKTVIIEVIMDYVMDTQFESQYKAVGRV